MALEKVKYLMVTDNMNEHHEQEHPMAEHDTPVTKACLSDKCYF